MKDYVAAGVYPIMPTSDSDCYFRWARDIANGDGAAGGLAFMKWPLYAYWAGLIFLVAPQAPSTVYFFQFFLGICNCLLVYIIGRKLFNPYAGCLAALLYALYGLFIFYEGLFLYTTLSLSLNLLLFLYLAYSWDRPSPKKMFAGGLLLGICALAQGNILIFGIVTGVWFLIRHDPTLKKALGFFISFLAGAALVIGIVTARNYVVEKDFVLIAGNTGVNFYLGNNPQASGLFYAPPSLTSNQEDMFRDARIIAEHTLGRRLTTAEVSRFWFAQATGFVIRNPSRFLQLTVRKIKYALSPQEFVHDIEFNLLKDKIAVFSFMIMDLRIILPFAILGMMVGWAKKKEIGLLYLAVFTLLASIIPFFISTRYRISVVPFLCLFAGYGLFYLGDSLLRRRARSFFLMFCAFALIFIAVNYWPLRAEIPKTGKTGVSLQTHLMQAEEYENMADYDRALQEYTRAHAIAPDNRRVLLCIGNVLYKQGNTQEAEEYYKSSMRISPLFVDPYYNLGLMYNRQQRFAEAREILLQAVALDSRDPLVHFELGIAYKGLGEFKKARAEFDFARRHVSAWNEEDNRILAQELESLSQ